MTELQAAKNRVTEALKLYAAPERSIATAGEVVDLLLDLQQYLAAVPEVAVSA